MKVMMKGVVKVAMKVVDAGSYEGGEGLILIFLWGYAFRQTYGRTDRHLPLQSHFHDYENFISTSLNPIFF